MAMAGTSSSSLDGRCTLTTFFVLVSFLLIILLYSKRVLEPSLSPYIDFFPQPQPNDPRTTALPFPDSPRAEEPAPDADTAALSLPAVALNEAEKPSNNNTAFPPPPPTTTTTIISDPRPAPAAVATDEGEDGKEEEPGVVSDPSGMPVGGDNGGQQQYCDLYTGRWVRDEDGRYPVYKPGSCPYVDEAFDCQTNGRPDSDYLNWRWKPDGCDLPRFNAADFLMRLRGKRLMLVGDSMNRNQFESMLCLLHEGLPNKSRMHEIHGRKITKGRGYYVFKFLDYGCTVEFVRSHFLVKEGVRINAQGSSNPTLSIDRIDKTSGRWKRADILVFNTGHWWTHGKTARGKNYYKEGDYLYPQFDAVEAYRRALKTWGNWVDGNINPRKQLVLYRGYSSAHFRGGDWDSGGSCNGETEPISKGAILNNYPEKMKIVEEVIKGMKTPVKLLNVTRLTNFRKDGHPSIYGKSMASGRKVSSRRQDCSHWCLPGVPDAWNELIYATLVFQQTIFKN